MLRKGFIAILLICLLAACGQGSEPTGKADAANDTNISNPEKNETPATDNNTNDPTNNHEKAKSNDASGNNADNNGDGNVNEESESENNTSESLTDLNVHYIDVGQADATLFEYGGHTILYDTGDWNRHDVVNYLDSQDVTDIDLVVISHPHADHIGQLEEVMHTYNVGEVWVNGDESSSQTFHNAMTAVLESDADYAEPRAGDEMQIGPMNIEVLHPTTNTGDLNKDSLSLRLTYGDISFIFTGDAYKEDERTMMAKAATLQATILQLGHHGSKTSSDPTFIEKVNPDVAIYSAGSNNSYGHPSPETVSLIQNAGITLYGTDVHGTIIVTTDGQTYSIQTKEDGTITPSSTGKTKESKKPKKEVQDKSKTSKPTATGNCISINDASIEELQEIIHIGPVRAEDVVNARPFDSVSDLTKVSGIGPARIADIKEQGLACTGG